MTPHRILLCEDDENLGMLLREYLEVKGYDITLCPDGQAGYEAFCAGRYSICVLDVMMPRVDGFTLARNIRTQNADIPIIFLTAKTMKDDVLEGFRAGGDDYLTKPFSMEELTFRIEAILRRVRTRRPADRHHYQLGHLHFDTLKQTLTHDELQTTTRLTTKECELLKLLCANAGEVLQRDYALKTIWIDDNYFNARSMDVYITKLRKHLASDPEIEILNVHGKGYKLVAPGLTDEAPAE